jgi:phosphatidylserine decarboxylase
MATPIFWNPYTNSLETENVFGKSGVQFLYQNQLGKILRPVISGNSIFSRAYGIYQSSKASRRQIQPFIKKYSINMAEYESVEYKSFNEFFIRKFRSGQRHFPDQPGTLGAPCEARYLFFSNIDSTTRISVKGALLDPMALLGNSKASSQFIGGSLAIARLCPVDYHRFHFFDDCEILETYSINGRYESVNPLAVHQLPDLFFKNERAISILKSKNFGQVAMVEVGALCVGKIIQSYPKDLSTFGRGSEKGYFLFGGSTVIIIFQPNKISWVPEFLAQSKNGTETLIKLGDRIGTKK